MSMGNYLGPKTYYTAMAAKRPRLGVNHVTVVPSNFDSSPNVDDETDTDADE
ncbi:hypothetical protein HSB1_12190 [Halogranum salarium B-1]|uniref:Uncharacterized protein n=1 Tax=Halogranum salarium B-1 TaxID=1210908 RepID=J3JH25_9EURY|nr:hypothetical protein HSB1_12190 [Halogranum salarium B-1]